ncbi:LAMI_0C04346g1_1 [Lachancea mirantina]|uniref:LAMI_0C04346g1_1 n=1 Tax=Lachancea mirantina TaxID=1230905 RepID=A0A1G4J239_9SACH|nr:LAMI_0C04346g1_1 [Lachancea mirantina]
MGFEGRHKKSDLWPISEKPKFSLFHRKKKNPNAKSTKKPQVPVEANGKHMVAKRSIRDRSSSNLTQDYDGRSKSASLPEIVSLKMSRQEKKKSPLSSESVLEGDNDGIGKSKPTLANALGKSKVRRRNSPGSASKQSSQDPSASGTTPGTRMNLINSVKNIASSGTQSPQQETRAADSDDNENNDSSGFISGVLSAAHNAANHLMRRTASSKLADESVTNQVADDTVVKNPVDSEPNLSFLQHLDFLLSTGPVGTSNALAPPPNNPSLNRSGSAATVGEGNSIVSAKPSIFIDEPSDSQDQSSTEETEALSLTDRIKFQPLKGESQLATFGKGNLSLGVFDNNNNSNNNNNNNDNSGTLPLERSSSRASHKEENVVALKAVGKRRKTISAINMHGDSRSQSTVNNVRENSPLPSTLNNSEAVKGMITPTKVQSISEAEESKRDVDNERRSRRRRDSKNFLSRRSFSPSNKGLKLALATNPRSSSQRNRWSTADYDTSSDSESSNGYNGGPDNDNSHSRSSVKLRNVTYADEKKNHEFHTIFKDAGISPNERLISEFSCALSRDILLQGKMFVSEKHICFNSSILGWVTNVVISLSEIVQIEKKYTAGIFPNGLVFHTLHTKYVFASLLYRDQIFDNITNIWNQIILGVDAGRLYDNASSARSNDDDVESEVGKSERNVQPYSTFEEDYSDDDDIEDSDMTTSDGSSNVGSEEDESHEQGTGIAGSRLSSLSTLGPSQHSPTGSDVTKESAGKVVEETVFNAPLGKIVNILFGNNVSYVKDILRAQKNYDLSEIPPILETKKREFTYTKPISGPIGPNKTRCQITETLEHFDLNDFVKAVQISRTPDVPSGNSFVVKTITYLSWTANNCTKMTISVAVEWTAKSWVKGAVEKGTIDGVTATSKVTTDEIKAILNNIASNSDETEESKDTSENIIKLPTIGPAEHAPTQPSYTKEDGDVVIDDSIVLSAPLGTIFKVLWGDDTSYTRRIVESQKNYDLSEIPRFADGTRKYSYTKPLNGPVGPKKTKCLIQETIEHSDYNTYVMVRQVTRTPDVPSGNSFSVHTKTFLYWGPKNTTRMLVVSKVLWTGKSWIKGAVEKGSIDGQKSSTQIMKEELKDIISTASITKTTHVRRRSRKDRRSQVVAPETKKPPSSRSANAGGGVFISLLSSLVKTSMLRELSWLIIAGFLIFIVLRFSSGSRHSSYSIIKPGKIVIDGNTYNYVPTLTTMYDVYEERLKHGKGDDIFEGNVVSDAESQLWNWIHDRGEQVKQPLSFKMNDGADRLRMLSTHEQQNLAEAIDSAEERLNTLKRQLQHAKNLTGSTTTLERKRR